MSAQVISQQDADDLVDALLRIAGDADGTLAFLSLAADAPAGDGKAAEKSPATPVKSVGRLYLNKQFAVVGRDADTSLFDQVFAPVTVGLRLTAKTEAWQEDVQRALQGAAKGERQFVPLRDAQGALTAVLVAARTEAAGPETAFVLAISQPIPWSEASKTIFAELALTPAEIRVLKELRPGEAVPELAARLGLSDNTVRTHIKSAYGKLGVSKQAELILFRDEILRLAEATQSAALEPKALAAAAQQFSFPPRQLQMLAGGQRLSFRTYGADSGPAVLLMHGSFIGAAMPEAFDAAARAAGVQVIAPERPGYGWSDRSAPYKSVAEVAALMRAFAAERGLQAYGVLTVGVAAAHGLELSRGNPAVSRVVMLSPNLGPARATAAPGSLSGALQRQITNAAPWLTDAALRSLLNNVSYDRALRMVRHGIRWSAPDRALMEALGIDQLLAAATMDARQHPVDGLLGDWRVLCRYEPAFSGLFAPMRLLFGAEDAIIDTKAIEALFPAGVQVERRAGKGHLFYYEAWPSILAAFAEP